MGVGTGMSAVWGVTPSVATPAPGPRPPPASASTTPGHILAGHAAPGARSDGITSLLAPSGAQGVKISFHQSVNQSGTLSEITKIFSKICLRTFTAFSQTGPKFLCFDG